MLRAAILVLLPSGRNTSLVAKSFTAATHLQLNYLLLCGDVHPNPGYENTATSDINSRVRRKPFVSVLEESRLC